MRDMWARHINNLYAGKAMLVRPYEYIVGRLSGKFLQSDPSLYRHNKKRGANNLASINTNSNNSDMSTWLGGVTKNIAH